MDTRRVLVCGSRNWTDRSYLEARLKDLCVPRWPDVIIHGAARGADTMAGEFAAYYGVPVMAYPADWSKHGRAAGPIRNARMLAEGMPTLVVAFAANLSTSHGTRDMVRRARAAGIEVVVFTGQADQTLLPIPEVPQPEEEFVVLVRQ